VIMKNVEKYIFEEALAYYGSEAQIKMLYEEMAELQIAVCKNGRGADNLDNIAEEIADVGIMLDQMRLLFNVEARSRDIRVEKVARLAERMDAG
jgi:NTP pyrophosphatase (non-canonical NTP hydrolase)